MAEKLSLHMVGLSGLKLSLPQFRKYYELDTKLLKAELLTKLSGYEYITLLYFSTLRDSEQVRFFHVKDGINNCMSEKALRSVVERLNKLNLIDIYTVRWNNVKYYGRMHDNHITTHIPVYTGLFQSFVDEQIKAFDIKSYLSITYYIILKKEVKTQIELAKLLNTSQSSISKSLNRLMDADLLKLD